MHSTPDTKTAQKAKRLRDEVARFHSGFKRQYPLLVDFVDGLRPLEDCSMSYYREKVREHLELMSRLNSEAARLEMSIRAGEKRA
jgi:hypothetical protein